MSGYQQRTPSWQRTTPPLGKDDVSPYAAGLEVRLSHALERFWPHVDAERARCTMLAIGAPLPRDLPMLSAAQAALLPHQS